MRLDDPVVEVLADPDPLVDDRETLDLLVESRVLDRHAGVQGEQLDKSLVLDRELGGAPFVREIEVADRPARTRIGTPRSECIGGWCGGNPYEAGCIAMSGTRSGRPSRMISPNRPCPRGSGPMASRSARLIRS